MLEYGSPCPKCPAENPGRIIEVDSSRKPPNEFYNKDPGTLGLAVTKYRCDRGHTWEEREP